MMKRHSLVGRFGSDDRTRVKVFEKSGKTTNVELAKTPSKLGYGIGKFIDRLNKLSVFPNETALDLMIIAAMVSAADSRVSRDRHAQDGWTREIDLYIPVHDLDMWAAQKLLLERMLGFLTGDIWRVFFRERPKKYIKLLKNNDGFVPAPFDSASLFSGGLDSFIGAIDLLEAERNPLFVSHYSDGGTSNQEYCLNQLAKTYGSFEHRVVRTRVKFPTDLVEPQGTENTSRGRSFLFFALAVLSASGLSDGAKVLVPENGLISLNIPLDPLRIGANSTRTTHPFYMARWQELLDNLGLDLRIENPYRFRTKGEMARGCANKSLLKKLAHTTISCADITKHRWEGFGLIHCGHCVPCIIRRSALNAGLGNDSSDYYLDDIKSSPIDSKTALGENYRAFQLMAERLRKKPDDARVLVHKTGPLSDYDMSDQDAYADVFERGIAEVWRLVKHAKVKPLS